jgi:hypothetical protein
LPELVVGGTSLAPFMSALNFIGAAWPGLAEVNKTAPAAPPAA